QLLATEDGADHALHVGLGNLAGVAQALDDLADRLFLARGLKVDEDGLADHEIRKLHSALHRRAAGLMGRARDAANLASRAVRRGRWPGTAGWPLDAANSATVRGVFEADRRVEGG